MPVEPSELVAVIPVVALSTLIPVVALFTLIPVVAFPVDPLLVALPGPPDTELPAPPIWFGDE